MKFCDIHIRDPFILPDGGRYYLYGSRGGETWGRCTGLDVYVSDDLENWSEPTECFTPPAGFWSEKNFWAPEVHLYRGRYYMFASFISDTRNRGTQILAADSPMGPFEPHSDGPVTPEEWMCLDGTLYVDEKNTPYMIFCHEWVQVKDGEMCAVELTPDLRAPVGEPFLLFRASQLPGVRELESKDYVTDGPFMYRMESGKLLMIWSSFGAEGYLEAMAESEDNTLRGKWVNHEELLFSKDGGHGMIFRAFDGRLMFVCHSPNQPPHERPKMVEICEEGGLLKVKE
ncbi:MAG: family 43 glycosylhydrolase [Clostridia bacterium]|nr:family 43 glycosylhydrolase [Clostridia bacterium]